MAKILRHDLGLTWVMDDAMQRGCHALLADDGRVWLVDPARDEEALAAAAELGEPAGVLQLLDRHNRDCAPLATQLGVRHWKVGDVLNGGTQLPFEVRRVVWNPLWKEVALWWPARRALVVAEALGTGPVFAVGGPVGVHPFRRLLPPGVLRGTGAEHLLVGHGAPRHGPEVAGEVDQAIARSWQEIPKLVRRLPSVVRSAR